MKERHRPRFHNPSARGEATPLHNVESFTQFLDEFWSLQEIIAVVSIPHDYELSARRQNSSHKGIAIAFVSYVDQAGAEPRRNRLASIGASVIGNDDFSVYLLFI